MSGKDASMKVTSDLICNFLLFFFFLRGEGNRELHLSENNLQWEWSSHYLELISWIIVLIMPESTFLLLAKTTLVDMKVPLLITSNIVSISEAVQKNLKSLMRILDSEHLMVMCA